MIGVLGGTFDPPHFGHLILADEARAALNLSQVFWVVTGEPPHKPDSPVTLAEQRLAMVELAVESAPDFRTSRIEIDRPGPHYAADTMEILAAENPDETRAYLMGKDSLRDLPSWHDPQRFVDATDAIAVLNRADIELDMQALEAKLPGLASKVHLIETPLIGIASRDLRRRIRADLPYRYLVGLPVANYIRQHQLYT